MQNIFIEFLPPWIETGLQPAFYDKESGSLLQQVSRMYAKMNELISAINKQNTTIEEYINKFIELKDYVDDYFENLDVQEEINNKLEDMAESGELEEIIATYINASSILAFDTITDMKSASNLIAGSYAETYGFYSKGDAGGAKYKVREVTNADTVDEMTLIALADESLVAELMLEDTMNVKQFGAKGDGETDDTAKIQKTLDTVKTVFVPDGTYMVNAVTNILMNDNNTLKLSENATLKAITNSANGYAVIKIDGADNVKIEGGTIAGERETHTGETGEWGHCISIINGTQNVIIKNIRLIDAWGDGLYIADAENVRTENVHVDNARRNGYSIIDAVNFHSLNDIIENVEGTAPQAGVDIEPNNVSDKLQDIVFEGLSVYGCKSCSFKIHLSNVDATSSACSITVNNLYAKGIDLSPADGIVVSKNQYLQGKIEFNNPTLESISHVSIVVNALYSECPIIFNSPRILDYNTSNNNGATTGSAIYVHNGDNVEGGNVTITNPFFTTSMTATTPKDIFINGNSAEYPLKKVRVFNPINRAVNKVPSFTNCEDMTLIDNNHIYTATPTGAETYGTGNSATYLDTKNYTANRTITMNSNTSTGYEITITRGNQYTPTITFNNTQKCYPLASTDNPSIVLGSIGSSITLRKISATEWVVTNQVGTITVS